MPCHFDQYLAHPQHARVLYKVMVLSKMWQICLAAAIKVGAT